MIHVVCRSRGAGVIAEVMAALHAILVKPAPAPRTTSPRKLREGTKQQQVLALLRRKRWFGARLPLRAWDVLGGSGAASIRTTLDAVREISG